MTRKFTTFTVLFSFLILFLTSFVLYVIPGGGSGAPWSFWGLSRSQWTDLHVTSGLLMLFFALGHLVLVRKSLTAALKKARSFSFRSCGPIMAALALNIFIVIGTLNHIQPVSLALSTYREFKQDLRPKPSPATVDFISPSESAALKTEVSGRTENP